MTDQRLLVELRTHALGLADELSGALRRIVVRSGDTEIEVEWQQPTVRPDAIAAALPAAAPQVAAIAPVAAEPIADLIESVDENLAAIASPMVGTFYRAPSPDAEPYVSVGDLVRKDQPIGVVEAMKLFNPIVAECSGEVVEILVKDAQPVEFGQQLMMVRPTDTDGAR
ncbi:MAG TPA: acetyl-CoA carboxylase biotin carboxyl carrier protein [Pseudonocardiaceae bacterium]|jgi:acetyl-CoA carboxylase biotin carboxyl carrier protein|nr:acetyl-CoA carboxylase biotin carboxyl carrier protein [Pseudonocardiaceae bacterium]